MSRKVNSKKSKKKEKKILNYKGFFAYPGEPLDRRKIIDRAITAVNEKTSGTHFTITS